jgi:hypothetical protein
MYQPNLSKLLVPKFTTFCEHIHTDLLDELKIERFEEHFVGVTTNRQSGEVVHEIRNIYDTGALADSQELNVQGLTAKIHYSAPHAPVVYFLSHGGRPWLERYVSETDVAGFQTKLKNSR